MPLPPVQKVNNLGSSFFNQPTGGGFNPQSAGSTAIPQIGSAVASGVGNALQGAFSSAPLGSALNSGPSMTPQSSFNFGSTPAQAPFTGIGTTPPAIAPTFSGGVTFPSTVANAANTPAKTLPQANPQTNVSYTPQTQQYLNNSFPTPNGGTISTSGGAGGQVTGFTPSQGYSIDTSGSHPSDALTSTNTMSSLAQSHSNYADYVQGLAQAQGYSPEYVQALQLQQQAQAQGAALQTNAAALNSNLYTGNNLPGDTMNYAQGATAKAQAQNTLQESQNSLQQLSANQAMQVQALLRSGNIAAAQSLVQASQPVGVSPGTSLVSPLTGQTQYSGVGGLTGVNALNQGNSLQQSFPDANIPSFDPSTETPQQWQQAAMKAVQSAPSFQSKTPSGQADISSLVTQQGALDQVNYSFNKANNTLQNVLLPFMQQYGINQSSVPAINQLQNNLKSRGLDPATSAGVISAFKADLQELSSDYSQVISRGGTRSVETDTAATALLDPNIRPSDIQLVGSQLQANGRQAVGDLQGEVNTIKGRLGGTPAATVNQSSGGTTNSSWPGWKP